MQATPLSLTPPVLGWTPPPSSLNPTIGTGTAIGGIGLDGYGNLNQLVAIAGPASNSVSPVPAAAALKGGTTGTAYSETITAQGGTSPYSYSITSGSVPTGTTMSGAGVISGTPSAAGSFSFTVKVTDAFGFTGSQAFTIAIVAPSAGGGSYPFVG